MGRTTGGDPSAVSGQPKGQRALNAQLARDCLTIMAMLDQGTGMSGPGPLRSQRLNAALHAMATTLFGQASHDDAQAFNLFDAMRARWPNRVPAIPQDFAAMHKSWRLNHPYTASRPVVQDLASYRRIRQFAP